MLIERNEGCFEVLKGARPGWRERDVRIDVRVGAGGRAFCWAATADQEIVDEVVGTGVAAAECHVRATRGRHEVAVGEARVDRTALVDGRNRIGCRDNHEGGNSGVDEGGWSHVGGIRTRPPDAGVIAEEDRTSDTRVQRVDLSGLVQERSAALAGGAGVVRVVTAVDAVVGTVRPRGVNDWRESLRVHHRVAVGEPQHGHEVALGSGCQCAEEHHAPIRAVQLAIGGGLNETECQFSCHPLAVGEREAHLDGVLHEPRLERVVHVARAGCRVFEAASASIADREGGVEHLFKGFRRAGPELRGCESHVDNAVDDQTLQGRWVGRRVDLAVLRAIGLAEEPDRGAAKGDPKRF